VWLRALYTFLQESFKLAQHFHIQFCIINETTLIILEKTASERFSQAEHPAIQRNNKPAAKGQQPAVKCQRFSIMIFSPS
jgi:hypothetical protein